MYLEASQNCYKSLTRVIPNHFVVTVKSVLMFSFVLRLVTWLLSRLVVWRSG